MKLWQEHQKARIEAEKRLKKAESELIEANKQILEQSLRLRDEMRKAVNFQVRYYLLKAKLNAAINDSD